MEQMMNQFYKKEKKPRPPKFRKDSKPKVQTFTMEEMMATLGDSNDILLSGTGLDDFNPTSKTKKGNKKYVSNTGGQRMTSNNKPRTKAKPAPRRARPAPKKRQNPKSRSPKPAFPPINSDQSPSFDSSSFERLSNPDSHIDPYRDSGVQTELAKMRAELKKARNDAELSPPANKLDHIMNDGIKLPRAEEVKRQIEREETQKKNDEVNMKEAIKYMTREERAEYLAEKRRKKRKRREKEEKKKNSFQPRINKKSKKIDRQRMQNFKFKRHDMLFGLGTVLKQREEQLKEMVQAEQFMKFANTELKECTFHPKINQTGNSNFNGGSIAERSKAYMAKKRAKIVEQQRQKEIEEMSKCTFEPKLNQKTKSALGHYKSKRDDDDRYN